MLAFNPELKSHQKIGISRNTSFNYVTRPLILTLRLFGLIWVNTKNLDTKIPSPNVWGVFRSLSFRGKFLLILNYLYAIHMITQLCLMLFKNSIHENATNVSQILSGTFRAIVALFIMNFFVFKQSRILSFTNRLNIFLKEDVLLTCFSREYVAYVKNTMGLDRHSAQNGANATEIIKIFASWKKLRIRILIIKCLSSIYYVFLICTGIFMHSNDYEEYFSMYWYRLDPKRMPIWAPITLLSVDWIVFGLFQFLKTTFLELFSCICLYIGFKAKILDTMFLKSAKKMQMNDFSINACEIHSLQSNFSTLCKLVHQLESFFSFCILLWYGDMVLRIINYVPAIVEAKKRENTFSQFSMIINVTFAVYLFVSTTMYVAEVGGEATLKQYASNQLLSCVPTPGTLVHQKLTVLTNHVNSVVIRGISVSACNCFVVDRALILTVFGVAMTYIFIMIQFDK